MSASPICSPEVETRAHVLTPLHSENPAGDPEAGDALAPARNAHPLWQEGYQKGAEDARRQAEDEILGAAKALAKAAAQLQSRERGFIERIQRDLLRLSLAIARRVVMAEIQTNPDALGETIARLLDEAEDRKVVAVRLHPDDAKCFGTSAAAQTLREAGIAVQSSPDIERGGVVLETGFGKLDARLETRFDEIATALFGDAPAEAEELQGPVLQDVAPPGAPESNSDAPRSASRSGAEAESLWENQPAYSYAHTASVVRADVAQPPPAGKITLEKQEART